MVASAEPLRPRHEMKHVMTIAITTTLPIELPMMVLIVASESDALEEVDSMLENSAGDGDPEEVGTSVGKGVGPGVGTGVGTGVGEGVGSVVGKGFAAGIDGSVKLEVDVLVSSKTAAKSASESNVFGVVQLPVVHPPRTIVPS